MTRWDTLVPDPLNSDRQYLRFYHSDVCLLEDMELTDELHALRPLLRGLPPDHWLRERVKVLESELSTRQYTSHEFRAHLKPKPAEGVTL